MEAAAANQREAAPTLRTDLDPSPSPAPVPALELAPAPFPSPSPAPAPDSVIQNQYRVTDAREQTSRKLFTKSTERMLLNDNAGYCIIICDCGDVFMFWKELLILTNSTHRQKRIRKPIPSNNKGKK